MYVQLITTNKKINQLYSLNSQYVELKHKYDTILFFISSKSMFLIVGNATYHKIHIYPI